MNLIRYHLSLEVAHSGLTAFNTFFQYVNSRIRQCIYTGRYKSAIIRVIIKSHNIHFLISTDIERLFIVNKISHAHQTRRIKRLKDINKTMKLFFLENSIDRCKTKSVTS